MVHLPAFALALLAACGARAGVVTPPTPSASTGTPRNYGLQEIDSSVKKSRYTSSILKFLEHWPHPIVSAQDARPVYIRAVRTPGDSDYIGMVKHSEIAAPLSQVVEATERFEDYPKIWDDVVSVRVISRDRNRILTDWTRRAPAFFLSRVHYRVLYTSDKSPSGRVVYLQQLVDGNMVKFSDSLVVLERLAEDRTRVTVLNFFNPEIGVFRPLVGGKIWQKSLENGFKDDIAFRAHLEHPDWSAERLEDEADRALDRFPFKEVEYTDLIRLQSEVQGSLKELTRALAADQCQDLMAFTWMLKIIPHTLKRVGGGTELLHCSPTPHPNEPPNAHLELLGKNNEVLFKENVFVPLTRNYSVKNGEYVPGPAPEPEPVLNLMIPWRADYDLKALTLRITRLSDGSLLAQGIP